MKKREKTQNQYFPYVLSIGAIACACFLLIYFLFFQVYFQSWLGSANITSQNSNINNANLQLNYDPLVTVVPKNLQSASRMSKFLISDLDPKNGPTDAKVIIIVWSRFDNQEAKNLSDILKEIKNQYGDEAVIIWKDIIDPNNTNESGVNATLAAHCANEQNKFWEYHDILFSDINNLNVDNLKKIAVDLSLDPTTFNLCLDEKDAQAIVVNNYYNAKNYKITSVPSLFVNDEEIKEIADVNKIKEVINKKLADYEN